MGELQQGQKEAGKDAPKRVAVPGSPLGAARHPYGKIGYVNGTFLQHIFEAKAALSLSASA
jgi:hypothetical protein